MIKILKSKSRGIFDFNWENLAWRKYKLSRESKKVYNRTDIKYFYCSGINPLFTKPGGRALIQNSLRFFHQGFEDFKFMIIIKGLKGFGAGSSARQSSGLLIRWPQVRILLGPPEKSITYSHSSFPALSKCSRVFVYSEIYIYLYCQKRISSSLYLSFL